MSEEIKVYRCIRCDYRTPFKHNYIHHLSRVKVCKGTVPLWDEYIRFGVYTSYQDIMESQQRKIEALQEEKNKPRKQVKYFNTAIDQEIVDAILEQKDLKAIKNESWKCLIFFSYVIHHMYVLTKCVEYRKTIKSETLALVSHRKQSFTFEEGTVKLFRDALTKICDFERVSDFTNYASSEFNDFQDLESEEIQQLMNALKEINLDYLL